MSIGAVGLQVNASWSSGPGCPATSFVLQAGSAPGLANIAQINVGGQLAVSAMVPPGNYYVRVIGSNQFGTSPPSEDLLMRVAVNALSGTIRPNGVVSFDVALTQTGPYIGSLTWVDPAIDLDFYLTSAWLPLSAYRVPAGDLGRRRRQRRNGHPARRRGSDLPPLRRQLHEPHHVVHDLQHRGWRAG